MSNHGGKREGAGRPALGETKSVSFRLPVETVDLLWQQVPRKDRARWVNDVLLQHLK